jgi:hypothetical protein
MTWVLLAWWYSRGLSVTERVIALFYLVFVALATLGTGEHYFIDLVVAVPFALFMESLFAHDLLILNSARIRGFAFGLLTTCAWLAALRLTPHIFWFTPILPWTLCAITIAVGLYLEMHLRDGGKSAAQSASPTENAANHLPETANRSTTQLAKGDPPPVLAEIPAVK